jgi:hypothetical protein
MPTVVNTCVGVCRTCFQGVYISAALRIMPLLGAYPVCVCRPGLGKGNCKQHGPVMLLTLVRAWGTVGSPQLSPMPCLVPLTPLMSYIADPTHLPLLTPLMPCTCHHATCHMPSTIDPTVMLRDVM